MDDENLREETLFLAVTRPTMWLGVPIEASLPIALAACLTLIITGNPLYAFALAGAFLAIARLIVRHDANARSEEHTSELQSLMRISYSVFCLKKKKKQKSISII